MSSTSRLVKSKLPCPDQIKCCSSDAYSTYDDGHGYCFSCSTVFNEATEGGVPIIAKSQDVPITNEVSYTYEYVAQRGITRETMEFFGCFTKVDPDGVPHSIGFPYPNGAHKVRRLDKKEFYSVGSMSTPQLFGMDRFSSSSAKAITITEGEFDALAVYQLLGSKYPVVSVRSSSSAAKDCGAGTDDASASLRRFLNSFDKIYLCLDNDEQGQKATREIARLFDFNKVYHVQMSQFKDANEYLINGKEQEFRNIWFNARRFLPEGILSTQAEFDKIIDESETKLGVPFPFPTLQGKTYGIRTGETYLFTALEGIGKTEIIRAIEYHLLKNTDANIGVIHLEESKARLLQGLAGYELKAPVHLPDSSFSHDEVKQALKTVVGRDERLHVYSHFGSSDPDVILDTIRFLVSACNCKYVFLDHISMVVSGLDTHDERKMLDIITTRLAMMVEELDFALIFVSHINDDGLTRGSRNISKIAGTWVELSRNKEAATEDERNTTYLTIHKNRFGAQTGPAGTLHFDLSTFLVTEEPGVTFNLPPVQGTHL